MAVTPAARPARPQRWPAALAWALAGFAVLALVSSGRLVQLVRPLDFAYAPAAGAGAVVLTTVSAVSVGALLAGRRPRHPVGWLLLGVGLGLAMGILVEQYVKYGLVVRPGSLPAARYLAGFTYSIVPIWLSCAGFVLLLTPTGSLPSPRWQWWARVAAAAPVVTVLAAVVQPDPLAPDYYGNPLAVPALARVLQVPGVAAVVVVLVSLLVGAGSLVGRFRRARGMERQQLRWLALAAALGSVLLLVALVAGFLLAKDLIVLVSSTLCVALLPLATGAAVLRYRLYDLDRIISRTVAYGLLTVLLGGGYAGVVLGLGQLLGPPPRPAGRRPALQPPPLRRGQDHRGVQRPPPPAGRPRHARGRAAGRGAPDHAADQRVAVAATFRQRVRRPAQHRRIPCGVTADGSFPVGSHGWLNQRRARLACLRGRVRVGFACTSCQGRSRVWPKGPRVAVSTCHCRRLGLTRRPARSQRQTRLQLRQAGVHQRDVVGQRMVPPRVPPRGDPHADHRAS